VWRPDRTCTAQGDAAGASLPQLRRWVAVGAGLRGRGGRLQGPARHRASCWVTSLAAPPARRGSDDCAVPRATKFESAGRAGLRPAPRAPPSRPGSSVQVRAADSAPLSAAGAPTWSWETFRGSAWAARSGMWWVGQGWKPGCRLR
jgi:hypothetical protein